jgi:undecaprenyl pyrophosphate synthase
VRYSDLIHRNEISVRVLGDVALLPEPLQHVLGRAVHVSRHYSK